MASLCLPAPVHLVIDDDPEPTEEGQFCKQPSLKLRTLSRLQFAGSAPTTQLLQIRSNQTRATPTLPSKTELMAKWVSVAGELDLAGGGVW